MTDPQEINLDNDIPAIEEDWDNADDIVCPNKNEMPDVVMNLLVFPTGFKHKPIRSE